MDFPATEKKRHGLRALLAGAGGKCVRDAGKRDRQCRRGEGQYPRTAAAVIGSNEIENGVEPRLKIASVPLGTGAVFYCFGKQVTREAMFDQLKAELDSIMERDPAARSRWEVYFLYSGFKAVRSYRKAHWFYQHGHKFIARWISQRARHKTGIEIHPGATIGKGLFIDHGMGVVIGETTEIGDNCTLYQNVTLGGTGKEHGKRHPTLGNNVMVGSGAKVLGPFKVGDNARVAAGAVVLDEVPANATAVGVPARVVRINGVKPNSLDQVHVADPVSQELCRMQAKCLNLQTRLEALEKERARSSERPEREKSAQ